MSCMTSGAAAAMDAAAFAKYEGVHTLAGVSVKCLRPHESTWFRCHKASQLSSRFSKLPHSTGWVLLASPTIPVWCQATIVCIPSIAAPPGNADAAGQLRCLLCCHIQSVAGFAKRVEHSALQRRRRGRRAEPHAPVAANKQPQRQIACLGPMQEDLS